MGHGIRNMFLLMINWDKGDLYGSNIRKNWWNPCFFY